LDLRRPLHFQRRKIKNLAEQKTTTTMALRMIGDKVMGLMAKQYQTALGNQLATYGEFWCCGLWIEIDADVSVAVLDWRATTEA
jgi:hypothetical protein